MKVTEQSITRESCHYTGVFETMCRLHVLLKLSGEVLGGDDGRGIDDGAVLHYVSGIACLLRRGLGVGVVIGGGNIFRGLSGERRGVNRVVGDHMGMLATIINGLALADGCRRQGLDAQVFTPFELPACAERFSVTAAQAALKAGTVAIFAGGTGNPFFSTDSAAALRAAETEAWVLAKGTKVDGVYDADPTVDPGARRFRQIEYGQVLEQDLKVMDGAAIALAREASIPIFVFDSRQVDNFEALARGDWTVGTLVGTPPPPRLEGTERC